MAWWWLYQCYKFSSTVGFSPTRQVNPSPSRTKKPACHPSPNKIRKRGKKKSWISLTFPCICTPYDVLVACQAVFKYFNIWIGFYDICHKKGGTFNPNEKLNLRKLNFFCFFFASLSFFHVFPLLASLFSQCSCSLPIGLLLVLPIYCLSARSCLLVQYILNVVF